MKKEDLLEHLRAAKSAHLKWVQKAKLLINGVEVEQGAIPVDSTECNFVNGFIAMGRF